MAHLLTDAAGQYLVKVYAGKNVAVEEGLQLSSTVAALMLINSLGAWPQQ